MTYSTKNLDIKRTTLFSVVLLLFFLLPTVSAVAIHNPNIPLVGGPDVNIDLNQLDDVTVPSPADEDILFFNSTSGEWESKPFGNFSNYSAGYWDRTGTELSAVNAGDDVKVDGTLKLQNGGDTAILGADTGATTVTDDTQKEFIFSAYRFDADTPNALVFRGNFLGSENALNIGGSDGTYNSLTHIKFYTGATVSTGGGTLRGIFLPSGFFGLNTDNPLTTLDVNGNATIRESLNVSGNTTTGALKVEGKIIEEIQIGSVGGVTLPLPFINSTNADTTIGNLTVFKQPCDVDDGCKNTSDWRIGGSSIAIFNYPFEGNGTPANDVYDFSTNENNATVFGATYDFDGGPDGKGMYSFDGNDYIQQKALDMSGNKTFFAYVRSTSSNSQGIYASSGGAGDYLNVFHWTTNDVILACVSGVQADCKQTSSDFSDTLWHTLAVKKVDNKITEIYVDGINDTNSAGATVGAGLDRIGEDAFNNHLVGGISNMIVYNRSLSQEQILVLHNNITTVIVSNETASGEAWSVMVTATNGTDTGLSNLSNTLTIGDANPNRTGPGTDLTVNVTVLVQDTSDGNLFWISEFGDTFINNSLTIGISNSSFPLHVVGNGFFQDGNVTADYFIGDGSLLTNIAGLDNVSWNETYADGLYAPNTTAGIQSLVNATGIYSTYNATYEAINTTGNIQGLVNDTYVNVDGDIMTGGLNITNEKDLLSDGDIGLGGETDPQANIHITNNTGLALIMERNGAADSAAQAIWRVSEGTRASPTIVSDGRNGGFFTAQGYDGNSWSNMARIFFEVNGTPGDEDMPGSIHFMTSPDGSNIVANVLSLYSNKLARLWGDVQIDGDLDITNNTRIGRGLNVSEDANFNSSVYMNTTLDVVGNTTTWLHHAEMYIPETDAGYTLNITSANTYYNITNGTACGSINGFTCAGGKLTVVRDGRYLVNWGVSFDGIGGDSDEIHFSIGVNGATQSPDKCHATRDGGVSNLVGAVGKTCIVDIGVGDIITIMGENEDDTSDVSIHDMGLTLTRIGYLS